MKSANRIISQITYVFYFPIIDVLWITFKDIKFAFYNKLHTLLEIDLFNSAWDQQCFTNELIGACFIYQK